MSVNIYYPENAPQRFQKHHRERFLATSTNHFRLLRANIYFRTRGEIYLNKLKKQFPC